MADRPRFLRRVPFAFPGGPGLALLAALAALAAAHSLVRTSPYGAVPGSDSVHYLSAAANLLGGEGLTTYRGDDFLLWPPGFPLLLAALGLTGIELPEAARLANAAALGLTVLAAGLWLRRRLRSRALALAAAAALAVSLPLQTAAAHLLTEALFSLLVLLALLRLEACLRRREDRGALLAAAACAGLAALTRWLGAAAIAAGVLLLLTRGGAPPRARLGRAAVFGAAASLPLAAALARNLAAGGAPAGQRGGEATWGAFADTLGQIARGFGEWALPPEAPGGADPFLRAAIVLAVPAGAAGLALLARAARDRRGAPLLADAGAVLPFAAFAAAYLALLVAAGPWNFNAALPGRFLAPLYAPLLLAAAWALDRLLAAADGRGRTAAAARPLALALLAAALLHAAVSAWANLDRTREVRASGWPRYELHARLRDSPTIGFAQAGGIADGPTWSSDRRLLWLADLSAAPGRHRQLAGDLPGLIRWLGEGAGSVHVVWLDGDPYWRRFAYTSLDLRTLPGVETIAELADGAVFRAERGQPVDRQAWERAREAAGRELAARVRAERGEPAARAPFDVYADAAARTLTYVRAPCAPSDLDARFFLHVEPRNADDLPADRASSGFGNLDFDFRRRGALSGGLCAATIPLPAYPVAAVRTGQFAGGDRLWIAEFPWGE